MRLVWPGLHLAGGECLNALGETNDNYRFARRIFDEMLFSIMLEDMEGRQIQLWIGDGKRQRVTNRADAGPVSSVGDGYPNAAGTSPYLRTDMCLADGWHQTVITVSVEIASAGANTVKLCNFISFQTR